jgi:Ca2+-transporting ATPase
MVYRGRDANVPEARTTAFITLALAQLLFSFGCRSFRYTLPQLGVFTNRWLLAAIAASAVLQVLVVTVPFLQPFFQVSPVSFAWEWVMIALLALMPVTVVEVTKLAAGLDRS